MPEQQRPGQPPSKPGEQKPADKRDEKYDPNRKSDDDKEKEDRQ